VARPPLVTVTRQRIRAARGKQGVAFFTTTSMSLKPPRLEPSQRLMSLQVLPAPPLAALRHRELVIATQRRTAMGMSWNIFPPHCGHPLGAADRPDVGTSQQPDAALTPKRADGDRGDEFARGLGFDTLKGRSGSFSTMMPPRDYAAVRAAQGTLGDSPVDACPGRRVVLSDYVRDRSAVPMLLDAFPPRCSPQLSLPVRQPHLLKMQAAYALRALAVNQPSNCRRAPWRDLIEPGS